MKVTMNDGREFLLARIVSRDGPVRVEIWKAEAVLPVRKMRGTFLRSEASFGGTPSAALARLYEKLYDDGDLEDSFLPCQDCGKGCRIRNLAESYVPHDSICPAMAAGKAEA